MITTIQTINFAEQITPPVIPVIQGDTGRNIQFEIADYTIPEGATATYYIQKPSGNAVYNTASISGNHIVVELTAQAIAETGSNHMQVRLALNDEIITSFDILLLVYPFRGVDAIESLTEMNVFDKAVEQAEEAIDGYADTQKDAIEAKGQEVIESIPADYTELSNEVTDLKADLTSMDGKIAASLITNTASGSIASFSDGADGVPVKDLVVDIEPVQSGSGDPSPTNVRPISGWTGANVVRTGFNQWDEEWELGGINDSTGEKSTATTQIRSKNYIPCIPGNKYYIGSQATNISIYIYYYDSQKAYIGRAGTSGSYDVRSQVLTMPSNCYYMMMKVGTITAYNHDICINFSDPAKNGTYEPYQGNTYSIDWTDEAGTVYGGTLDVTTGVLTVDRAILTNEQLVTASAWESAGRGIYVASSAYALPNVDGASYVNPKLIASALPTKSQNVLYTNSSTQMGIAQWWGNRFAIGFADSSISSVSAFKEKLAENGTDVVYPIVTPQTYQLTPQEVTTLLGQNNIWADCGDTTVEYRANTKLYIEKLTAPTEDDLVANTNIPDATYFMVGNNLYLSTTTIPAGDVINPGTNCTLMNLAAALNAINA